MEGWIDVAQLFPCSVTCDPVTSQPLLMGKLSSFNPFGHLPWMLPMWAWNISGICLIGEQKQGLTKVIFTPFVQAHALVSVKLDWGGLAPLCPCPHPLPSPDSHRKSSLLACQPLFPSILLEIPAKCILLAPQEGTGAAARSYRQCVYARQLINQGFFQRIFNFIFGCLSWRKGQRKVQRKWKACKTWSGFVLHWGIFYALLVM